MKPLNSKQIMKRAITIGVLLLALSAVSWTALAQTGGGFDLSWFSVDGGGGTSAGGDFALVGSLGQPDAGNGLAGGGFTLTGGFQAGAASATQTVLCILHVERLTATAGTLDVTVDSAATDSFPGTTRFTFTQTTPTTNLVQVKSIPGAVTDTWWQADWTIAGGGDWKFHVYLAIQ